ncbi:aminotransferase [Poseidonocella sp. HB161398]|uniref:aminotransferase n=1 Tax=Poseidonocella sp. HB161398 TaxID=2320855 RepID=UPI001108B389|nr:aminotransferase [Poseidonocella sp. HB161398]
MDGNPNSLEARDILYQLHPSTPARSHQRTGPLVIAKGDGAGVIDTSGRRYIEAMSGLWCAGLGFSEPRLAEAAYRQMLELPYYHGFSHKASAPAVELAERLVRMAPVPMSKVFFASSGSEANDTAVKLVRYRSNALGQPARKKIIARHRGFHGVTMGAASLTGLPVNHASFDLPLPGFLHATCPDHFREGRPGESEEAFATRLAEELEAMIQGEGPETVAAFWAEPVMGAAGVIVPPATYWEKIQAVLARHGILLVADEVICGFGRTGRMFGSEACGLRPDIMILSKQLASGYQPIAAVMMNDAVFEPVADESERQGSFGHGLTSGGHPVPCAVALETLDIIEERGLVARAARLGASMQSQVAELAALPAVAQTRGIGLMAAVELDAAAAGLAPGEAGPMVRDRMQAAGVIVRAMGDAIALCPPMMIPRDELDTVLGCLRDTIAALALETA